MKSLKRCAEESAVWLAKLKLADTAWTVPVISAKRYEADTDGDAMEKPILVIGCHAVNPGDMYDPALGEAILTFALIRDVRAENHEELDGFLFDVSQIFLDPSKGALDAINETSTAPHYGSMIVHEFAPPDESGLISDEDDTDVMQMVMHLQHYLPSLH